MDILETLKNNGDTLSNDEIECLKEELDLGNYSTKYIIECKGIIDTIMNERLKPSKFNDDLTDYTKLRLDPKLLKEQCSKPLDNMTILKSKFQAIRQRGSMKELLDYINSNVLTELDIDSIFSFLNDSIIGAILYVCKLLTSCFLFLSPFDKVQ